MRECVCEREREPRSAACFSKLLCSFGLFVFDRWFVVSFCLRLPGIFWTLPRYLRTPTTDRYVKGKMFRKQHRTWYYSCYHTNFELSCAQNFHRTVGLEIFVCAVQVGLAHFRDFPNYHPSMTHFNVENMNHT